MCKLDIELNMGRESESSLMMVFNPLPPSSISCHITFILLQILRMLEYININDHLVEDNLKVNAAVVLIF